MLAFIAALLAPGKMPSIQKLLRPVLFGAIGLTALGLGSRPGISAFAAGQCQPVLQPHFSLGGLDLSPPDGWRMQVMGPSSVLFEHVSGPTTWTGYTERFNGKIDSASVGIDIPNVASQTGKVRGAGLMFCNHVSNNVCDAFYVALFTSDSKMNMFQYENGNWISGSSASFSPSNSKYMVTAYPDLREQGVIHFRVNSNEVAFGGYPMPQRIGILMSLEPGSQAMISDFHVKEGAGQSP